ncbi:unnamed protein product [Pleuronectes platessa]|uniref:Uncharacterized protein n=1 Tax=Pleuronectes platessa TaxID=8262 RepID=A0A9N7VS12_PLEPL|nr:unnamed protein product [Pleuronectes platessa]
MAQRRHLERQLKPGRHFQEVPGPGTSGGNEGQSGREREKGIRDDRSGRRADGQWPPSSVSAHSIEPLESASSICNFKASGRALQRVREETRGPSRHEITDYTLNASPRGLSGVQESKIEGE